ncbi:MAG: hypothetical protein D6797_07700 [Bdellovibrio sp.]|nr:MAG: hypothetical protein D6797_07700 [Bdellovibrio sp.]
MKKTIIRLTQKIFLYLLLFGATDPAMAIEEANTLPAHIQSFIWKSGSVSGLNYRYSSSGDLLPLSNFYAFRVDGNYIAQQSKEAQAFIQVLNQMPGQLGDQLQLGTLVPEFKTELKYLAPIYSIGVNSKWTLAIGIPVFHYKNAVQFSSYGSNVADIQKQAQGDISMLQQGFQNLNRSLTQEVQTLIKEQGYTIDNKNQWLLGDIQLASLFQIYETDSFKVLLKEILQLPTGPKDNPDDLLDLDFLGQTALDTQLALQKWVHPQISFFGKLSYKWIFPDHLKKRVPQDKSDIFPGPETAETVQRDPGDEASAEIKALFKPKSYLLLEAGTAYTQKAKETYKGGGTKNYALLNLEAASWTRLILGAELSTISWFKKKIFSIPLLLSYHFNDIFQGSNKERQTIHEISLSVFF